MEASKTIRVEVFYASSEKQQLIACDVHADATIEDAIQQSGILAIFPEIDLQKQKVGIYSQTKALTDLVKAGDRIEIYRPLLIDPKEARRAKAVKAKK